MKDLSLGADFEEWSWEKAGATATQAQVKVAYEAIKNKGQTKDFSRFVWNDIVDKLYSALTGAGESWDDKYTTYSAAIIQSAYGNLTADIFNSVAYNIEKPIGGLWKWAYVEDFTGYLGRERVKGVSTNPENADTVYGAYIEELTRKLNVLISILKNKADFGELAANISATTNYGARLLGGIMGVMAADAVIRHSFSGSFDVMDGFSARAGWASATADINASQLKLLDTPKFLYGSVKVETAITATLGAERLYRYLRSSRDIKHDIIAANLYTDSQPAKQTGSTVAKTTAQSNLFYNAPKLLEATALSSKAIINIAKTLYFPSLYAAADIAASSQIDKRTVTACPALPDMRSSLISFAHTAKHTLNAIEALLLDTDFSIRSTTRSELSAFAAHMAIDMTISAQVGSSATAGRGSVMTTNTAFEFKPRR